MNLKSLIPHLFWGLLFLMLPLCAFAGGEKEEADYDQRAGSSSSPPVFAKLQEGDLIFADNFVMSQVREKKRGGVIATAVHNKLKLSVPLEDRSASEIAFSMANAYEGFLEKFGEHAQESAEESLREGILVGRGDGRLITVVPLSLGILRLVGIITKFYTSVKAAPEGTVWSAVLVGASIHIPNYEREAEREAAEEKGEDLGPVNMCHTPSSMPSEKILFDVKWNCVRFYFRIQENINEHLLISDDQIAELVSGFLKKYNFQAALPPKPKIAVMRQKAVGIMAYQMAVPQGLDPDLVEKTLKNQLSRRKSMKQRFDFKFRVDHDTLSETCE